MPPLLYGLVIELLLKKDIRAYHQKVVSEGHPITPIIVQLEGKLGEIEREQLGEITVVMAPIELVPVSNLDVLKKMITATPDQVYVTLVGLGDTSVTMGRLFNWTIPLIMQIGAQASRFRYSLKLSQCDKPDQFLCDHCMSVSNIKLQVCSGCRVVRYCNQSCQQNNWASHKPACALYQTIKK